MNAHYECVVLMMQIIGLITVLAGLFWCIFYVHNTIHNLEIEVSKLNEQKQALQMKVHLMESK